MARAMTLAVASTAMAFKSQAELLKPLTALLAANYMNRFELVA
ncbi:14622_t:CDS:2 [Cetraspora pellucida]|uniref:14622_t:CDS:1 n=1 Tax=Cetraspora pellucida TaxID=1433469 RepID=A0ACA9KDF5_9GLOM|nr:14622_t:CDS:2 [Cetraspora pellucida]